MNANAAPAPGHEPEPSRARCAGRGVVRVRLFTGQISSAGTAVLAAAGASVRSGGDPRDAQHEAVELLRALDALSAAVAGCRARTEEFLYATAVARGRGEVGLSDGGGAIGVRTDGDSDADPDADADADDTLPDLGDPERIRIAVLEAASEAAVATRTTTHTMSGRMTESNALRNRFPATLHALCDGLISPRHAAIIRDRGERIAHADDRAAYEHTLVPIARETTPGRLDRAARREAERYLREPLTERHRRARHARRVWLTEDEDAMCILSARLPLVLGTGIHDRLTRYAKLLRHPAEPRRLDHLRADVLSELLLTGVAPDALHDTAPARNTENAGSGAAPDVAGGPTHDDVAPPVEHAVTRGSGLSGIHAIRGRVAVTVPALTLLGRADDPALLGGRSPIPIEQAATLLADAPTFTRILTHPATGVPVGSDRHDPGAALREHLRARDAHCRFPGCLTAALHCDLDHTHDWQHGGATTHDNLAHLCRAHHMLKHRTEWLATHRAGGVIEWTSPHGRRYIDIPDPTGPVFAATPTLAPAPTGPRSVPDHVGRAPWRPATPSGPGTTPRSMPSRSSPGRAGPAGRGAPAPPSDDDPPPWGCTPD